MTIRKRQGWGSPGTLDAGGIVIHDDAAGSRAVAAALREGREPPMLGLVGGDLCRTLGGTGDPTHLYGPDARRYPVDLGIASIDGVEFPFIAHVIVRRRCWRGRIVAVMNAQWRGTWDLGPRSHPNDGLLDITDARLGLGDKLAARKRLRTGTHVPHPDIETVRVAERTVLFDPPGRAFIDGSAAGPVHELRVGLQPDALTVVI